MAEGLLGCLRPLLEPAAEVRDAAERDPDPCQSGVVFCLLEERQRRPREPLELVDAQGRLRTASAQWAATTRASASPAWSPASRARSAACSAIAAARRGDLLGRREIELEVDIEPQRPGQLERPLEQRRRPLDGRRAQSARRPAAARRSPARSASPGSGCPSSAL